MAIRNSKNISKVFWAILYNQDGPIDFQSPYDYDSKSGTSKVGKD